MKISLKQTYKLYHSMYDLEIKTNGLFTEKATMLRLKIKTVAALLDRSGTSYKVA